MAERPIIGRTVITWICDGCKKPFSWDDRERWDDCAWFGSYLDMDNGDFDRIVVICSRECRELVKPQIEALKKKRSRRRKQ